MTPLLKKLNYKDHPEIFVLNHPIEFQNELEEMKKISKVTTQLDHQQGIKFLLCFVKTEQEVKQIAKSIETMVVGDGIVWLAFPKGSSRKYKVAIGRDNGWDALGVLNYETVRSVAIDEDWSALRFRKVEFIKNMTRNESMKLVNNR